MSAPDKRHLKLAEEILSPVLHLFESDNRFQEYLEAVAKRLMRFEEEILENAQKAKGQK